MTKVVHIITRMDMGGSAQNTLRTCLGLSNEKYEVVLIYGFSLESGMTEKEKDLVDKQIEKVQNKKVHCISLLSLVRRIDPIRDIRTLFALWKLMMREKPVIVHTHTSKAGILGRLAAIMSGVPIIIHTAHGHVFYGHFASLTSKLFLFIEKIFAFFTDCLVALTEGEKKDYIDLAVMDADKIATIHSGVDIACYMNFQVDAEEKKRSLGLNPKGMVVGTVGWLLPIKGPMILLKAMERVWQNDPEVELVYVGKGEMETALKAQAVKMGVSSRVKFPGWRDDIDEIMPILDVFVLPSLNEGMGRVIVEAMAACKPVVASRVGGIPDLVKHGHNGFLVEPGDVHGLSSAIERLLSDKKMRAEMGRRGQAIAQGFGVAKMVDRVDDLYVSLLQKRKTR